MKAGIRVIGVTLASVLLSLSAAAQPARVPRIGVINEFSAAHPFIAAFRDGLRELGYTEGHSIVVEYRHAEGVLDRVTGFAAELSRMKVDVMVVGGTISAQLAKAQTTTVPIVFATSGDPVSSGLVATLARPGGNLTGISILTPELTGKQLELLKAAVPRLSRATILYNPGNPTIPDALPAARSAAAALGLELQLLEARAPKDVADAFTALTAWRAGALLALADPMLGNELQQIATLAARSRVPAMYVREEFAAMGGLLAYGPSFRDNYRRTAGYVDRILKGATPAELPVQQPSKFDLVVNLRTAKTLGLTIPPALLLRADKVIE